MNITMRPRTDNHHDLMHSPLVHHRGKRPYLQTMGRQMVCEQPLFQAIREWKSDGEMPRAAASRSISP